MKTDRRRIEQIADDEIVDAVAGYGLVGLDIEDPWEGNAFHSVTADLGLIDRDEDDAEVFDAEARLMDRMSAMPDRIINPDGDRMHLTSAEWGRRLAGKSAEEIAKALDGVAMTCNCAVDDEDTEQPSSG